MSFFKHIKDLELPKPVAVATKFIIAAPFVYHTFNGIRHLVRSFLRARSRRKLTNLSAIRPGTLART